MSRLVPLSRRAWQAGLVLIALAALAALLIGVSDRVMKGRAMEQARALARNDSAILATGLQSELDKFSLVPLVLAEDPEVRSLLDGEAGQQPVINRRLEALALQTRAAALYLMDADGLTLAASNWQAPTSFVGSNYQFRRYFTRALRNGSATQFALGTVSRRPGLYIAQRVGSATDPRGVVVVKVEFDPLEANWRQATDGVFVTDGSGVVLITSQERWRFHLLDPDTGPTRDPALDRQQFGITPLQPLDIPGIDQRNALAAVPLLDAQQPISPDGWVLHLLIDPSPQIAAAIANGRLVLLLILIAIAVSLGLWLWLRARRERLAAELIAAQTRTLREQLTQANRLATLGQVSAGIGHEISQPVAAARVFAENGEKLVAAGKIAEATSNFGQIVALTDRIGQITQELRRFSRRQASEPRALPIGSAIDGALLLLHDRIESANITLTLPNPADQATRVMGEHVRLEQVLVNLLQNAVDAAGPGGRIALAISTDAQSCDVTVTDSGPGIDPEVMEQLFQPFTTTKPHGLGLGLAISRDIMRDLGGDLTVATSPEGASFTMKVLRA